MSDDEIGDSGKTGAFLMGFLLGVVVCLMVGSGFFYVVVRRQTMSEMRAREEAMVAREYAERAAQAERKARDEMEAKLKAEKEKQAAEGGKKAKE